MYGLAEVDLQMPAGVRLRFMTFTHEQIDQVRRICADRGIRKLAVFGSRSRDGHQEDSDLDLLVEFFPGRAPGFFGLAELAESLSQVLGGLTVDLRTPRDLSRHFRDEVTRSAEVLYAA